MAQLSSPGVSVTVIDESFYTPAAPGTVPLIVVASQANKENSAGTGTAPGTLAANAGKVYLLTSQMDLGNTFGIPYFQTDAENNPVNAGEINEYGLQAAYSFLGVSNRAYVVRADVDLAQLKGSAIEPAGLPEDGTYWLDTATTNFGVFEWNGAPISSATNGAQTFEHQTVHVINPGDSTYDTGTFAPLSSFGALGDYAIVAVTSLIKLWSKKYNTASDSAPSNAGTWVEVGSSDWIKSWPTVTGTGTGVGISGSGTLIINGYTVDSPSNLADVVTKLGTHVSGVSAAIINGYLTLFSDGTPIEIDSASTLLGPTGVGIDSGTYNPPALSISPHYQVPQYGTHNENRPTGSVWVKTTPVNQGASWDIKKYNGTTESWVKQTVSALYMDNASANYALDPTGGGINIPVGAVYVKYNDDEHPTTPYATFKVYGRASTGATVVTSSSISNTTFPTNTYTFTISETGVGNSDYTSPVTVSFTSSGTAIADARALLASLQAALANTAVTASLNTTDNTITIAHTAGGDIKLVDGTNTPLNKIFTVGTTGNFFANPNGVSGDYVVTAWTPVTPGTDNAFVTPSASAPTTTPADQTLWYNSSIDDADILVNDGAGNWVGYLHYTQNQGGGSTTDPNGPIISATQPTLQSDGTALANGDLWIDSSDLENWPKLYKFNFSSKKWVLVDNTDQTTENGIVFADARWNTDGGVTLGAVPSTIKELLTSDFVDFDAPDPLLYPKGILLYNLRRSSFNVKRYVQNYVDPLAVDTLNQFPDRWVSDAANHTNGSGTFGRKAQRAVVVQSLNALIESNQQIRDEDSRIFNLISCPGYLETLPALESLNIDRGLLSFIVADAPARLSPDATTLSNWGNNVNNATGDGEDGLVSTDPNSAVYYPWGYTTDLKGNNIVVPPSHIMLRTIALSDNVSYPWFAPAGTRRGGVTNASSVGYVDATTGEYQTVALNTGQRDTLAAIHVNPITYIGGVGLVAYGQKTRQLVASALDRINVARLVTYLRYQLNAIAKPFIFEPNDTITRNEIKQQIEKLMLELTGERALYDYLVVCDTSNNTPARIDANELHVDIAIEPVKAVEFIYIPLRLENTGAIKGLSK
jgi:Phage tail sheath C-terminal domain